MVGLGVNSLLIILLIGGLLISGIFVFEKVVFIVFIVN